MSLVQVSRKRKPATPTSPFQATATTQASPGRDRPFETIRTRLSLFAQPACFRDTLSEPTGEFWRDASCAERLAAVSKGLSLPGRISAPNQSQTKSNELNNFQATKNSQQKHQQQKRGRSLFLDTTKGFIHYADTSAPCLLPSVRLYSSS